MTIRELREKHLLTLSEMAKKLNVSTTAVLAWEKGTQVMSFRNRRKCLEVFGVDPLGCRGGEK